MTVHLCRKGSGGGGRGSGRGVGDGDEGRSGIGKKIMGVGEG